MAYIGKSPTGTGVRSRFYYTQTSGGGTSISGTDDNSKTLTFTDGEYIDVFLNGVLLVAGTDYNTNTANTISGLAALANGDVVEVVVYDVFTVADTVSASQGGTFQGNVVFNGTTTGLDLNGTELILDADADTSITADTDDNIDFKTGGTDRLTISDDGTVKLLGATDNLIRADSNSSRVRIFGGSSASVTNGAALTLLGVSHSDGNYADLAAGAGGTIRFRRGTTENARFDSSGNFAVGQTTPSISAVGANIRPIGLVQAVRDGGAAVEIRRNNSNGSIQTFRRDGTVVGGINVTTSSTSYATSSDYRLKENVADLTGAIARVKQLAPKRFNFISDADTTVDGFLAHEAQTVVPEAVHGTHNEVDDDGNAVMQGIDQAKLVPLLTGALKEAIAKIETLETKVAALENAE